MHEPLSFQERAEEMLKGVPSICKPMHLAERLGCSNDTIRRHITKAKYHVLRLQSGHRRIPKATQLKIAADFIRMGWNG